MEYHWPFAICISLVVFFVIASVFVLRKYEGGKVEGPRGDEIEDPSLVGILPIGYLCREELWSSCGGVVSPSWLLCFRALCFLYLLPQLVYNVLKDGAYVFFFYTQWTFTLLIVYFALALRVSVLHYLDERTASTVNRITPPNFGDELELLDEDFEVHGSSREVISNGGNYGKKSPGQLPFARGKEKREDAGFSGYATQIVFQALLPAALLTDMVYWCILVPLVLPASHRHNFIDVNMHAVNVVLLLLEFSLNSLRFPWFRISYLIFWSAAYTFFQWTLYSTRLSHGWPYPFMNVDTPYAPAWYLFIIAFHGVCYAVCLLLALAKQSVWSRHNFPVIGRMTF